MYIFTTNIREASFVTMEERFLFFAGKGGSHKSLPRVIVFYGRYFKHFMVETIGETMDTVFHVIKNACNR